MMHLNIEYVILHFAQSVATTADYHATRQCKMIEQIKWGQARVACLAFLSKGTRKKVF